MQNNGGGGGGKQERQQDERIRSNMPKSLHTRSCNPLYQSSSSLCSSACGAASNVVPNNNLKMVLVFQSSQQLHHCGPDHPP
jgi:hypothetical protein